MTTLPSAIMHVLATMALLCNLSLAPVMPEPMPDAMTAGAVLEPDEAMVEMLACGIYQEAGGDECSDECR